MVNGHILVKKRAMTCAAVLARRGVRHSDLEVKLFGGSDNIETLPGIAGFRAVTRLEC